MKTPKSVYKLAKALSLGEYKHIDDLVKETKLTKSCVLFNLRKLSLVGMIERDFTAPNLFKKRVSKWREVYRNATKFSRKIHNKRKIIEKYCDEKVNVFHEHRKCKSCQGRLELSRWWNCVGCKRELPSDAQWDWMIT